MEMPSKEYVIIPVKDFIVLHTFCLCSLKVQVFPRIAPREVQVVSRGTISFPPKNIFRGVWTSDGNRTVLSREVPGRSQDGTGQDRT